MLLSPHPRLRLTLLTSLQPEEFQQQAGLTSWEQILEHLDNLRLNLTNTKQNCTPSPPLHRRGAALTRPSVIRWAALRNLTAPLPCSPFSL